MSNEIVVQLHDRRAKIAERMQIGQNIASAVVLVPAGLSRIHAADPLERMLAYGELTAVAVLFITTVRELRDHSDKMTGVSWSNLGAGIALVFESLLQTYAGEHRKWFTPAMLTGITSIFLGLMQARLRAKKTRLRRIVISDDGLDVRLSKFRKWKFAWSEIRNIELTPRHIRIVPVQGKPRSIRMRFYTNGDEIRGALEVAAQKVPTSGNERLRSDVS
ncbi:MAG: hypothetical protein ABIV28_09190 [Longimicrobiales bacterium]